MIPYVQTMLILKGHAVRKVDFGISRDQDDH